MNMFNKANGYISSLRGKALAHKQKKQMDKFNNERTPLLSELNNYKAAIAQLSTRERADALKLLPSDIEKLSNDALSQLIGSQAFKYYMGEAQRQALTDKVDTFFNDLGNRFEMQSDKLFCGLYSQREKSQIIKSYLDPQKASTHGFFSPESSTLQGSIDDYKATYKNAYMSSAVDKSVENMVIVRALSDMTDQERFYLRTLRLLHIYGIFNQTDYFRFALIMAWGDGKGNVLFQGNTHKYTGVSIDIVKSLVSQLGNVGLVISSVQQRIDEVNRSSSSYSKYLLNKLHSSSNSLFDENASQSSKCLSINKGRFFLGELKEKQALMYSSDRSLITVAAPGSGKSLCQVVPNLANYRGSVIVLDVKSECYQKTAQARSEFSKVLKFNPSDAKQSVSYNPLDYVSREKGQIWQDCIMLAKLVIVPTEGKDQHFDKRATDVLTIFIAYSVLTKRSHASFDDVLDLLCLPQHSLKAQFEEFRIMSTSYGLRAVSRAIDNLIGLTDQSGWDLLCQYLDVIRANMSIWEEQNVSDSGSKSDWSAHDFKGQKPLSLYITIPPNSVLTYAPLLRVIIGQHVRKLMAEQYLTNTAPVLFMLDEFPRLGYLEPILDLIETGRGYGLQAWIFAQNMEQLKKHYPNGYKTIIESMGVQCFMNPSLEVSEYIAKSFGEKFDFLKNEKVRLIEPSELNGAKYRESIFVIAKGEKPAILKKVYF